MIVSVFPGAFVNNTAIIAFLFCTCFLLGILFNAMKMLLHNVPVVVQSTFLN